MMINKFLEIELLKVLHYIYAALLEECQFES